MGVDPTKLTDVTSGCTSSTSTATLSPWTTLNTPLGRPACSSKRAINKAALGSHSLGFNIKVLPAINARGNIQQGTMQGKLKGVMPATTPRGCRITQLSRLEAT